MSKSKSLQELNLIDAFLFSATTENPKDAELIAKIIIERATGKKVKEISVIPEKQLSGINMRKHGIRMDLYITESEENSVVKVYDIEPNKYDISEIPRRSRYNQALTDVKLLSAGEGYENLADYISVWILPKDPFGENRMVYTVQNSVVESSQIVYNDGVTKLFLYVDGEIGGSEELRNLLQYFSKSDEANVVDEDIKKLHKVVESIKKNQEMGEKFMTFITYQELAKLEAEYEVKQEAWEEGIREGKKEGKKEGGILALIKTSRKYGASDEQIIENLIEEYELSEDEAKAYLVSNIQ